MYLFQHLVSRCLPCSLSESFLSSVFEHGGSCPASELPSPPQVHYDTPVPQSEVIQPPPAPLIKDMDSFSEGTAQGSFDFTMCSDPGDAQAPPSVAFSPGHPTLSIEIWRDDVVRSSTDEWPEEHSRCDENGHTFEVGLLFLRCLVASKELGSRSRRRNVADCHCSRPRQRRSGP
jgi:hypothetical protein